ncbi:hypothetical protein IJG04_02495 [Candidatus Saccharibacteria bacterium]|nr:hypothetical protein [Candidatus Saccharibacteria bacterium]
MKHKTKMVVPAMLLLGSLSMVGPTHATSGLVQEVNCANLQTAIDEAENNARIALSHSNLECQAQIVIPSGKSVYLYTGGAGLGYSGDGNTITISDGATLYLSGSVSNMNLNFSAISNFGRTYIVDWQNSNQPSIIYGDSGTAITNFNELNVISDSVEVLSNIVSTEGIVRLAGGGYDDQYIDTFTNYVTNGCDFVNSNVVCEDIDVIRSDQLAGPTMDQMPIGYNYTVEYNYPELAEIKGYFIASSDPQIINVQGSALEGYNITAQSKGSASMSSGNFNGAGIGQSIVYDVTFNGKSILPNSAVANQLIHQDVYGIIGENLTLPVKIEKVKLQNIDISDDEAMLAALGNGKVAGYYDVECFVTSENGLWLASVYDLNDEEAKVSFELPENLPAIADGYERSFYVIRKHQDTSGAYQVDILPTEVNNNEATVFSDKFSLYILAYIDTEIEEGTTTPETGHFTLDGGSAIASASIATMVLGGIAYCIYYATHHQKSKVHFDKK